MVATGFPPRGLSATEAALFEDPEIESAYQGWSLHMLHNAKSQAERDRIVAGGDRKQFLMRIRALVQSGAI